MCVCVCVTLGVVKNRFNLIQVAESHQLTSEHQHNRLCHGSVITVVNISQTQGRNTHTYILRLETQITYPINNSIRRAAVTDPVSPNRYSCVPMTRLLHIAYSSLRTANNVTKHKQQTQTQAIQTLARMNQFRLERLCNPLCKCVSLFGAVFRSHNRPARL